MDTDRGLSPQFPFAKAWTWFKEVAEAVETTPEEQVQAQVRQLRDEIDVLHHRLMVLESQPPK